MRIIIDGQKVPVTPRVTRDLLGTVKSIAKMMNWGIHYDTVREIVYINSKSNSTPIPPPERPAPSKDEVESARLSGKVICLDPGHGGSDPGAVGLSGTVEKDNTLAVALLLRDKLEKNGAKVVMTRDSDRDVAFANASADEELGTRVDIANDANADVFISIHNDSFTSPTAAGTTTFHYGDAESIKLATFVQKALVDGLGTKDRGARYASFYVIRYTNMPAILVETAFISNPEEEVLLSSCDGRTNAADSIFQGIVKYFKV